MSKNRLFDDFASMSKAEWFEMVSKDPRSANLLDKLDWHVAGVSMPAYATREDLEESASARNDTMPTVSWAYPGSWKIAQAFKGHHTAKDFRQALDAGTEAIWIEADAASGNEIDLNNLSPSLFHLNGAAFELDAGLKLVNHLATQPGSISILTSNDTHVSTQLLKDLWAAKIGRSLSIHIAGAATRQQSKGTIEELSNALNIFNQFHTQFKQADLNLTTLLASVQFVFTTSTSFYLEIARLRAFRLLLSKLICELSPAFTSTVSIPFIADVPCDTDVDDVHSNILRSTTMAMAAVLGGCELVITHPFSGDHTDASAVRIARNIQLMLKHESHLDHVADPGAGSFYIETLTQKLASEAWTQFLTNRDTPALI
ncbi:MAG: methylmalonyl-CoA mutase family protein [Rhodothermales bacterium]